MEWIWTQHACAQYDMITFPKMLTFQCYCCFLLHGDLLAFIKLSTVVKFCKILSFYLNASTGSSKDAFLAGYQVAIRQHSIEAIDIIATSTKSVLDGNCERKYISSLNKSDPDSFSKKRLIFSMFSETVSPSIMPSIVPSIPIEDTMIKKVF